MDALTISTTFATIVGLICNFKQEVIAQKGAEYEQFMGWLAAHQHMQVLDAIAETYHLQSEVTALLREDTAKLAEKLNRIEGMIAAVLSQVGGFAQIAAKIHPGEQLSKQAVDILKLFVKLGAEVMIICQNENSDLRFAFRPPAEYPRYGPAEPRFFEDDMASLVRLGFMALGSKVGDRESYLLTRAGARYVERLGEMETVDRTA